MFTTSWKIGLAVYAVAVVCSFLFFPDILAILGLPFSIPVVMLGMLIIHAGSGSALEWALLISTIPSFLLLLKLGAEQKMKKDLESS